MESLLNKATGFSAWNFIKKRHQHMYFPENFVKSFAKFFKKPYLQNTSRWLLLLIPSFQLRFYPLITLFPSFFPFYYWWLQLWKFVQKGFKNNFFLLFTIIYPKIKMLLRQFRLGNNLPTHIRENTDFPRQIPRINRTTMNLLLKVSRFFTIYLWKYYEWNICEKLMCFYI